MADKELDRVRPDFVKGVSEPVIKLLLDDLVKDGVLNGMERESILEENGSRADKARCLIDIVKNKGDKASSKMIVHLKSGDSSLCEKLDTVSYRDTYKGSILIQYIVQVFNTFAHQDDIDELFRKVMQRFEDFEAQNRRQMPTKDRCTLTRHFYFFPGL